MSRRRAWKPKLVLDATFVVAGDGELVAIEVPLPPSFTKSGRRRRTKVVVTTAAEFRELDSAIDRFAAEGEAYARELDDALDLSAPELPEDGLDRFIDALADDGLAAFLDESAPELPEDGLDRFIDALADDGLAAFLDESAPELPDSNSVSDLSEGVPSISEVQKGPF